MTRTLLILAILTLNCLHGFAQTTDMKIESRRISLNGDSLIKQEYELIIKSKKVYFITPFASYLHIKGEKYRTRVKLKKNKREKIFNLVDHLIWTNLKKTDDQEIKNKYFLVGIYGLDNLATNYKVADELWPPDFKELYDTLSGE